MGSNERRDREKKELRARILDAARELFADHGFDAVTMRRIAQKIEYTPTALYFHFADKDELMRELCNEDFLALGKHFATLAGVPDPVERFRGIGRAYADFAITHPHHYRVMFMIPPPLPEDVKEWKGDPMKDAYAFLRWTAQECIDAGLLRPEFADADLASQVAWSAVHGVVALQITRGSDTWIEWRDIESRVDAVLDMLVRGMVLPGAQSVAAPPKDAAKTSLAKRTAVSKASKTAKVSKTPKASASANKGR